MAPLIPASRVEVYDVPVPANTAQAAAIETPTIWAAGELVSVDVRIPDGAAGLVGFRILYAHSQAIPTTPGAWIIGNDDLFQTDVMGQLNGGQWSILAYNLDRYPHSLHVRYFVADLSRLGGTLGPANTTTPELS
jgi:hypothetical protein